MRCAGFRALALVVWCRAYHILPLLLRVVRYVRYLNIPTTSSFFLCYWVLVARIGGMLPRFAGVLCQPD